MVSCFRVEPAEFDAGVGSGELPTDGGLGAVSLELPGGELACDVLGAGQSARQTLAGENGEFNFCYVQPGAVLRSIVPVEAGGDAPGFGGGEAFVEGGWCVDVEIVRYQHDLFRLWVEVVREHPQVLGEVE